MPSAEAVYGDYEQNGLDEQYNNRARVPDFSDHFATWQRWSEQTRETIPAWIDVPFGPSPGEKIDIFPADETGSPIYVFIHGGYWYSLDKQEYSFVAEGMKPHGVMTVVNNYGLGPAHDMGEIVRQNRAALAWIWQHAAEYGGDRNRIYVTGHSAGGHLAAMLLATDWPSVAPGLPAKLVKGACAIAGIFDLEPIRLSYLNETLRLTTEDVECYSPIRQRYPISAPLLLVVGGDESDEFQRQSKAMERFWRSRGDRAALVVVYRRNHFDVLDQLRQPDCELVQLQLQHIREAFA